MDYNQWEMHQLREECIIRRLSMEGNRLELIQRLVNDCVENRRATVYKFDSASDPDGSKERQYIQEETAHSRWAHVTLSDAAIAYHKRQIGKITAEKRSGVEALAVARTEALLSVDDRVKGLPPKNKG